MRVIEYLKALQPRRAIWFTAIAIGGVSISGLIGYAAARITGSSSTPTTIIGVLAALLIILFLSGFNAWDKEQRKNADKWPRLSPLQRIAIAKALRPLEAEPKISLFINESADSLIFATDLSDALTRATNGVITFMPQTYPFPLASGLRIDASTDDARGPKLKKIIEKEIGIEAHLERRSNFGFQIYIGMRV